MIKPLHILSLGAGVQSSTLALMAASGEIGPMPVAAIFADTQAEPKSVYKWLDWLEGKLPFPVYRVTIGSLTADSLKMHKHPTKDGFYIRTLIPAYLQHSDRPRGILGRKCTADYKVAAILKKAREIAKVKRGQASPVVTQWIGISLDEAHRMKPSREKWARNIWPLIDAGMKRHDCLRWMQERGFPTPPRSACSYCPFHSDREWRRLRDEEPEDFKAAIQFEKDLQRVAAEAINLRGKPFLHGSLKPLDEVDFSTAEDHGQQLLFGNDCEGMCGV